MAARYLTGRRRRGPVRISADAGKLGPLAGRVQAAFLEGMAARTEHAQVKVMMPDSTVSDQSTFDPALAAAYMSSVLGGLEGWESDGVSETRNDDVRRTFAKFSARGLGHVLSCHLSLQYHVLLHYRPDARVAGAQKELAEAVEALRSIEGGAAEQSDAVVARKLAEAGYGGLDDQGVFEALFNDDRLRERISAQIGGDEEYRRMAARRQELVDELDSLLLETYQTSCVQIDEARLVTGEEGLVCTADLERESGGVREGHFDISGVPGPVAEWAGEKLENLLEALLVVNREADTEEGLRGRSGPPDLT